MATELNLSASQFIVLAIIRVLAWWRSACKPDMILVRSVPRFLLCFTVIVFLFAFLAIVFTSIVFFSCYF